MKVCCISDMHGNLEGLDDFMKDVELVIIAGDFAKMNGFGKWHINDMKKWIQKKFIPWTQKYPNVEFAIVPGNHDLIFDQNRISSFSDIDYKINWPNNIHILIDNQIEIKNHKIYGTPWVPIINYRWAFEAEHDKLMDKFNDIPSKLDILITHSPPRLEFIDFSLQTHNGPFGSSELTQSIYDKKPRYVFCGHIHSGNHDCFDFSGTKIYNVSRVDENYEIAYDPLIIEI